MRRRVRLTTTPFTLAIAYHTPRWSWPVVLRRNVSTVGLYAFLTLPMNLNEGVYQEISTTFVCGATTKWNRAQIIGVVPCRRSTRRPPFVVDTPALSTTPSGGAGTSKSASTGGPSPGSTRRRERPGRRRG